MIIGSQFGPSYAGSTYGSSPSAAPRAAAASSPVAPARKTEPEPSDRPSHTDEDASAIDDGTYSPSVAEPSRNAAQTARATSEAASDEQSAFGPLTSGPSARPVPTGTVSNRYSDRIFEVAVKIADLEMERTRRRAPDGIDNGAPKTMLQQVSEKAEAANSEIVQRQTETAQQRDIVTRAYQEF